MTGPATGAPTGPGAGFRLRPMEKADLPVVLALERAVFPEDAWTEAMLASELAGQGDTHYYLVAEIDGEVAGYAGLFAPGGDEGDVQTIAVRADRQGRGIGNGLLSALISEAADRGCREVFLDVRAGNAVARRLYRRAGFTDVGVRRGYYQPSGADAIVMRLDLRRLRAGEGQRVEGQRVEGQRVEGQRGEGQRVEGQRGEGQRGEGQCADGRGEGGGHG